MTPCVLPEMIGVSAAKAYDWPVLSGIGACPRGSLAQRAHRNRRLNATGTQIFRLHRTRKQQLLPVNDVRIEPSGAQTVLDIRGEPMPGARKFGRLHV